MVRFSRRLWLPTLRDVRIRQAMSAVTPRAGRLPVNVHRIAWYLMHDCLYVACAADPQRRGAALATVLNGNLTMQGPVMLKQGYRAAVARTPVFIQNVSEDNYFGWVVAWGVGSPNIDAGLILSSIARTAQPPEVLQSPQAVTASDSASLRTRVASLASTPCVVCRPPAPPTGPTTVTSATTRPRALASGGL